MPDTDSAPYLGLGNQRPYTRHEIALRCLWSIVQATLFRWSPRFLHGWRVWLLSGFGAQIVEPATVRIYPSVRIVHPWKLRLEAHTLLGPETYVYNLAPVTLRRGSQTSRRVHLCAGSHDYRQWAMPLDARPIDIGANVWIATEVFVGPGVTLGELCIVGARSVVVKNLPARMVCAGNPCKPIKERPDPV